MKFLDANGLALFTKKIFSKFVSNITGADNKITITKGDGTTNEINLNEVVKTDVIGEDPPDDDNSNKIASTRWVQKFVTTMVFKLISKLAGTEETGVSSSGSFLGVNWLIAQNGYICLGKLFGGLILQWGMFVTNVEQGKNNTFTFPIAFKNNLYFYWAFDYTGYFYNLIIKNKDINSCYIYGAYPNGTEQTGELAPTGVSGISVFIGS
ncbi:hypothetical protein GXM21_06990 [Megamonas funiformis]|uniref:Putative tail fiber protein gp53-like C-terminal domain-containing protein n=2 Tax=Megamonas TaxID=158846 RepID=A0ABP2NLS5_9FIRM|nr:hypothetical protein [Megamonas funiformis]EHR38717.1 hypothetical protein HMPREF9454_00522 [Megamonas funiformis YIT 11815]QIB60147.1 hypothetical protein GXM21_06990 [Megamonas funiformis]UVX48469.1 MAG: hypothetical protein [Bacteriophage sp.]UWF98280.1 MAG: hypothetical protein [Bacteriophage sp.]